MNEQLAPTSFEDMREEYERSMINDPRHNGSEMSMFGLPSEDNLIRWQLDLKEDLDRIYHLLKGDEIVEDSEGNISYCPTEDPNLQPFNEQGVQTIMNIMQFYLNRNTLLSNYDHDTIKEKVLDFGRRLTVLIHNRYEEIMMTLDLKKAVSKLIQREIKEMPSGVYVTDFEYSGGGITYNELPPEVIRWKEELKRNHLLRKIKMTEMLIGSLVDSVHSAYLRAYQGGERDSLRTGRTVNQVEQVSNPYVQQQANNTVQPNASRKFSLINPRSWVG